jgi:HEPN domain-containing protein
MPHDPARVADAKGWLSKAADDLEAAEQLLKGSPALLGAVVFHCQQAVEKAMKGFLAWHDVPFRKTHELEEIGEACLAIDPALKEIIDSAVPLTQYAWKYRYPGETGSPTQEEAEAALMIASEVCDAIASRLREEVQP